MATESIGFVGVGRMGGRMARRLLDAGIDLTIYDTSADVMKPLVERGAHVAESPAAVASACEVVLVSLPTPPVVESVALGPRGIAEGNRVKIFIDTSTTGATAARRIADGLAKKNIIAVDSPVSGGLPGAEKGTLAVMVSGPEEILPRLRPVLENLGKIFYCGTKPGMGQTMKLLNNLLSATAMAITSEAVVMGVKAGLDPGLVVDVLNAGTARNTASTDKFPRYILPRTFNAGFAMGLFNKDIRLCLEEADALGVPMIVGNAVRQLYSIALASEGPTADMTEVVKPVERWAGAIVGPVNRSGS
ncbi:MAG TPA: NAD(P)-dependent oxidoreductase [Terriglobia bacterium]|nr:NAD(P)-dependent oxidoreductase [Terriglobia bacterium]